MESAYLCKKYLLDIYYVSGHKIVLKTMDCGWLKEFLLSMGSDIFMTAARINM